MLLICLVLLSLGLLFASFLCSITEVTLLSLNPLDLKLKHSRGAPSAGRWLALKGKIERPIAAILVFNTLFNTGLSPLTGALFVQEFGSKWLWLYSVTLTIAIIFLGELAPKILGVHYTQRLAGPLLRPLEWMIRLTHPLLTLMDRFCEILKPKQVAKKKSNDHIMDIITLVEAARAEQSIHSREEIIIIHAATLSARRVHTVMVPSAAIVLFDERKSLVENVRDAGPKLHRSYPVSSDGTLQGITGYIRVRDAFVNNLLNEETGDWRHKIRPVLTTPDKSSITQLLASFLENREIAAIVQNNEGNTIGWITMDDVTETLMGSR
jgi:CBS domain containing-hemolysin-like protein